MREGRRKEGMERGEEEGRDKERGGGRKGLREGRRKEGMERREEKE